MLCHASSATAPHHLWGWWFNIYSACLEDFLGQTAAEAREDTFIARNFEGSKSEEENQVIFCPWESLLTSRENGQTRNLAPIPSHFILRQFLNSMLLILFEYRHFHLIWDENKYLERKSNVLWSREKLKRLDLHLCERLRLKNLYAVSQVHKYVHFQLFL